MPLAALLVTLTTTGLLEAPADAQPASGRAADVPLAVAAPADSPPPTPSRPAPAPTSIAQPAPVGPTPPASPKPSVFNLKREDDEAELGRAHYGLGKGFTVASKDGRYKLQLRGRIQLRYDFEHPNVPGQADRHSLQIRRARVSLAGNVFSPHVKYRFQFGFSPNDMMSGLPDDQGSIRRNPLRDARIEIDRLRDFTVAFGQFKVPFSRQRRVSSSALNLVDRSLVNAEFSLDRDIGVEVLSKDLGGLNGRLGYHVGVFMGEGRNASDLNDLGMLFVGRFLVRPFGNFEEDSEGDPERSPKPGLAIAAAYAFQDRAHAARGVVGNAPADGGTTDFHHAAVDLLFKWRGLSFTSALHLRRGFNRVNGGALDDMNAPIATAAARQGLGWLGQLGYVVPKIPLEVVGRYSLSRGAFGTSSLADADEAGGGLNWYFVGHDLKLQLDYFRLWDASMGATPAEAARHGTDRLRLQVQVHF